MKKNVGLPDKIIRYLLAILFIYLYATDAITGTVGIVLMVLGIVFALTATINFCPLYTIFGISTNMKK